MKNNKPTIGILGTGIYIPDNYMTAKDIAAKVGWSASSMYYKIEHLNFNDEPKLLKVLKCNIEDLEK